MKALLIPLAATALFLSAAAAPVAAEDVVPGRVPATELPTQRQTVGEILAVLDGWSYLSASSPAVSLRPDAAESPADNRLDVLTLALERVSEDDWDVAWPVVQAALPLANRADGIGAPGSDIRFATLLARRGQDGEALEILNRVRDTLIAYGDDLSADNGAGLWLTIATAYAYAGDAAQMRDALARGVQLRRSTRINLPLEMYRVRALADAGYRADAYRLLAQLLGAVPGDNENMIAFMGPTMVARTLVQIGDPSAEAIVHEILEVHIDPENRAEVLVVLSETALDAGNTRLAMLYADAALRILLSEEPPYRQVALYERTRPLTARLGQCDITRAIGELVSIAHQLEETVSAEPSADLLRTNGQLYDAQSAELLECHQAGDAVRFILDHAAERGDVVNGLLADIPESERIHRGVIRSIGRASREFVTLYHRASSDAARERLGEALSRIIPPENVMTPPGSDPARFGDDPEFMIIWIKGALASGRRHDAERVMLAYYNRLPETPAPRLRGLITLLPYLSDD